MTAHDSHGKPGAKTNRLAHEKSPYLQQHATNPVDWYPWGEEAFAKAQAEDKPIFLSVGYSTCHWCHVMAHESFENEAIAAYLNEHFVSVKVDREERPDVDAVYMAVVQGLTGRGGWPMTVFLTPDRKPFFGGTYFPPEDRQGMVGFRTLLEQVQTAWTTQRDKIDGESERIFAYLETAVGKTRETGADSLLTRAVLDTAFAQLDQSFDARHGGFGGSPKFPTPHKTAFLLRYYARTGNTRALDMVTATLDKMAAGGIHDHLGGGFHRYSVDSVWLVPHFEKMLYDQAGMALLYTQAFQVTGKPEYRRVAEDILEYVKRDLTLKNSGFYSAEDADSEGEEGTFYVWTPEEVDAVLGPAQGEVFRRAYRVTESGNFEGKNILNLSEYKLDSVDAFAANRQKLFEAREKRIRPHRDEKMIAAWNGFMIEAFAKAGGVFDNQEYIVIAANATRFIDRELWAKGRLLRHAKDGAATVPGFLDDYAFYARGLLALYEATFDYHWLDRAIQVTDEIPKLFARAGGAFSFRGKGSEELIAEVVEGYDGAMPSGNSAAAVLFLRLGHLTANRAMEEHGWDILRTFAPELSRSPTAFMEMAAALDFGLGPRTAVVVAGPQADETVKEMQRELITRYAPNTVAAFRPSIRNERVLALIPYLAEQTDLHGEATAYVCRNYACKLPVHDVGSLLSQLEAETREP